MSAEATATSKPKFEETRVTPESNDRTKWSKGPWDDEPDYATWYDEETGLPCLIVRNRVGALCGYVGLSEGHPLHGVRYQDLSSFDVHGGLTFGHHCGGHICHTPRRGEGHVYWLGFDTAHGFDYCPGDSFRMDQGGTYRTIGYVAAECTKLAAQLVNATADAIYNWMDAYDDGEDDAELEELATDVPEDDTIAVGFESLDEDAWLD